MALKKTWLWGFLLTALISDSVLVSEIWLLYQTSRYNSAVENNRFAEAKPYRQKYGLFAKAYAHQQAGHYQQARVIYTSVAEAHDMGT